MYFLTGRFPHAFSWLSLFGTTLVRDRFDSRVYICRIIFVLFVPGYSAITIRFSWTFICRDLQLAKDSHGGEADCNELVNPWWVIRQFFTDGSPTPYGYTAGVRPIKVASLGTKYPIKSKSTSHQLSSHQSPVIQSPVNQAPVNQLHQSPVNQVPVNQSPVIQVPVNQAPVTSQPVTSHQSTSHQSPSLQSII